MLLKAIRHPDISGRTLVPLKPEFIYMKASLLIEMRLCLAKGDKAPVWQGWDRMAVRVALGASISEIHLCMFLVAWGCSYLGLLQPSVFCDFTMANQWVRNKSWIWVHSNSVLKYRNQSYLKKALSSLCFCYLLFLVPSIPWDTEHIHKTIAFHKLPKMETHCVASKCIAPAGKERA